MHHVYLSHLYLERVSLTLYLTRRVAASWPKIKVSRIALTKQIDEMNIPGTSVGGKYA